MPMGNGLIIRKYYFQRKLSFKDVSSFRWNLKDINKHFITSFKNRKWRKHATSLVFLYFWNTLSKNKIIHVHKHRSSLTNFSGNKRIIQLICLAICFPVSEILSLIMSSLLCCSQPHWIVLGFLRNCSLGTPKEYLPPGDWISLVCPS